MNERYFFFDMRLILLVIITVDVGSRRTSAIEIPGAFDLAGSNGTAP